MISNLSTSSSVNKSKATQQDFSDDIFKTIIHENVYDPNEKNKRIEKLSLKEGIMRGFKAAQQANQESCVLLVGNTGSGKSTLINYLFDVELIKDEDENFLVKEGQNQVTSIGVGMESETYFTQVIKKKGFPFALCDTPGYGCTSGRFKKENERHYNEQCQAINVRSLIEFSKEIKSILVVISYSEVEASKAEAIDDLVNKLSVFLEQIIKQPSFKNSINFIVTKRDRYTMSDETIRKKINELAESRIKKCNESIESYHEKVSDKNQALVEDKSQTLNKEEEEIKFLCLRILFYQCLKDNFIISDLKQTESKKLIGDAINRSLSLRKEDFIKFSDMKKMFPSDILKMFLLRIQSTFEKYFNNLFQIDEEIKNIEEKIDILTKKSFALLENNEVIKNLSEKIYSFQALVKDLSENNEIIDFEIWDCDFTEGFSNLGEHGISSEQSSNLGFIKISPDERKLIWNQNNKTDIILDGVEIKRILNGTVSLLDEKDGKVCVEAFEKMWNQMAKTGMKVEVVSGTGGLAIGLGLGAGIGFLPVFAGAVIFSFGLSVLLGLPYIGYLIYKNITFKLPLPKDLKWFKNPLEFNQEIKNQLENLLAQGKKQVFYFCFRGQDGQNVDQHNRSLSFAYRIQKKNHPKIQQDIINIKEHLDSLNSCVESLNRIDKDIKNFIKETKADPNQIDLFVLEKKKYLKTLHEKRESILNEFKSLKDEFALLEYFYKIYPDWIKAELLDKLKHIHEKNNFSLRRENSSKSLTSQYDHQLVQQIEKIKISESKFSVPNEEVLDPMNIILKGSKPPKGN